jgi:hypothetical protein
MLCGDSVAQVFVGAVIKKRVSFGWKDGDDVFE